MEVSKSVLKAMALGLAIGASMSSCSTDSKEENEDLHFITCTEDCSTDHVHDKSSGEETSHNWENCPACGMG